jgi:hypothetical protein
MMLDMVGSALWFGGFAAAPEGIDSATDSSGSIAAARAEHRRRPMIAGRADRKRGAFGGDGIGRPCRPISRVSRSASAIASAAEAHAMMVRPSRPAE